MNELGLYIHIPFCAKKCYYCDFISYANKENKIEEYFNALIKEIEQESKKINKEDVVTTIYIGGGTPSFVPAKYISKIVKIIKNNYIVEESVEITIEVNPRNSR